MHALLVQSRSPTTYWSFEHTLPFIRKSATYPPLGLATVAALLPSRWEVRLRDLNVAPLDDADLAWADAVLVSGMLVQAPSVREVLRRARALGRRTVVGGPAASSAPELFEESDHLFRGEAEGRLDLLVRVLEAPAPDSPRLLSPEGDDRPDLRLARVPRFDLLELSRYGSHALQYSRGCPFRCEFCDIIEIFGRVPRVKSPEQVVAELDALHGLGARGTLFFLDDNFVGNRGAVARLLPVLRAWQEKNGFPFVFCTEASIDLATHPELVSAMVDAGFGQVFVGLETPSTAALAEAGKTQNLRMPQERAVEELTRAGLEVYAGFIVGFDSDGPDIFDRQLAFISGLPIARAMVNLLMALPRGRSCGGGSSGRGACAGYRPATRSSVPTSSPRWTSGRCSRGTAACSRRCTHRTRICGVAPSTSTRCCCGAAPSRTASPMTPSGHSVARCGASASAALAGSSSGGSSQVPCGAAPPRSRAR